MRNLPRVKVDKQELGRGCVPFTVWSPRSESEVSFEQEIEEQTLYLYNHYFQRSSVFSLERWSCPLAFPKTHNFTRLAHPFFHSSDDGLCHTRIGATPCPPLALHSTSASYADRGSTPERGWSLSWRDIATAVSRGVL